MDHAGFLAAIRLAPDDPAPRLIYADWLDEQGDPRATLIRLEEEMRPPAVFDDEYWLLKERRDPLRAAADAGWLSVLGYDLPRPVFAHGWPADWRGRWRLLRQFAENWRGVTMGDVGRPTGEVLALERRLGRELPPSLREFVAFHDDLGAARFGFLDGVALEIAPLGDHPALALGAMDDMTFAVRYADLDRPDPPVTTYRRIRFGLGWRADSDAAELLVSDFVYDGLVGGNFEGHDALEVGEVGRATFDAAAAWFGDAPRIDGRLIGERPGVYANLFLVGDESYSMIRLDASPRLPTEAVPQWAWNLCLGEGWFTGRFLERHRVWRAENPVAEDDTPF